MDTLCEAVRLEMRKAFKDSVAADWQFESPDSSSCAVHWNTLIIKFVIDQRDKLASSSITFLSAAEEHREELYTHVLVRMFSDVDTDFATETNSLASAIAAEVRNISRVLRSVETEALLPRDLFYFHNGYSCGYTDFVSAAG